MIKSIFILVLLSMTKLETLARPQSLMLEEPSSPVSSSSPKSSTKATMTSMRVESQIQFRYAQTTLTASFRNADSQNSGLASFEVLLPSDAFVSNFSMTTNNNDVVVAKVLEKEEARNQYDSAVSEGRGAGLAESRSSGRDSNRVAVDVNVEPEAKIDFKLVYEQLLPRKNNKYEHKIRLDLPQPTLITAEIKLNESRPLTTLETSVKRAEEVNAIDLGDNKEEIDDNELFNITRDENDLSIATVTFELEKISQSKLAKDDGSIALELKITYDVDRKSDDIQVIDGYFVHFVNVNDLPSLPKHVVFVLDVSGSMSGEKLRQTKDAMVTILDALNVDQDFFNLITFSSNIRHWAPQTEKLSEAPHSITHKASNEIKSQALRHVLSLEAGGGTNIHDALKSALETMKMVQQEELIETKVQSIIVFLTDGSATSGITADKDIKEMVKSNNREAKTPIYSLAFGQGADFELLKQLSNENFGLARRIYEGADAALQLEDFYNAIGNPVLADLKVNYVGELVKDVTKNDVRLFAQGQELIVAGKIDRSESDSQNDSDNNNVIEVEVRAKGKEGEFSHDFQICFRKPKNNENNNENNNNNNNNNENSGPKALPLSTLEPRSLFPWPCFPLPEPEARSSTENFIERLWAFRSITEILKEIKIDEEKSNKEHSKALELSLKYNFVTPLTSLVLINNETSQELKVESAETTSNQPGLLSSPRFAGNCHNCRFALSSVGGQVSPFNFRVAAGVPAPVDSNVFYDDTFDDASDFEAAAKTDEVEQDDTNCRLHLYNRTYLRGNVTVVEDYVASLASLDFDDKLTSMRIEGDCCFRLFVNDNFEGESMLFREGEFPSASMMGMMFRSASSLRKEEC